jgi:hypothetical protein
LEVHSDVADFLLNEKLHPDTVKIKKKESIYMGKFELSPIF